MTEELSSIGKEVIRLKHKVEELKKKPDAYNDAQFTWVRINSRKKFLVFGDLVDVVEKFHYAKHSGVAMVPLIVDVEGQPTLVYFDTEHVSTVGPEHDE